MYSLTLAACGGFVFCTSIRPVAVAGGILDWPWVAALTVVAVTWLALPVPLLILGLVSLHQGRRLSIARRSCLWQP